MDINTIKELIEMMKVNDLSEIKIDTGEEKISLKRGSEQVYVSAPAAASAVPAPVPAAAPAAGESAPLAPVGNFKEITAPVVGTFYSAPSPTANPFVKVGDTVNADDVVCIVEAMKVMNEVKAEISGTITKILVENGQAIEFGQPMFLVEPA
ncbi:MAG: acetyl-CoA carboxylase biotin carboxyl carrier protein [Phycisphaerae bacterium]|nr:acetyl-CoA carboxylase biotin carboxyl carrier protein [Phycisphaerae bacterium]